MNIFDDILNGIKNALAEGYHLTRIGLTDIYTDIGALGRETGDLIVKHKLIPFSQAIQDVENQSVANTPVFSGLSKLGIEKGSQLFNSASQLVANILPITGTFGHLSAHPDESLPQKISDIALGLIDIPGLVELADTGRLVLTGADELSTLGKLGESLGESKAFNYPLLALGLGSMLLPSHKDSHKDEVITKESIYKAIPNVLKEVNKEVNDTVNPEDDPLALTVPSEPEDTEDTSIDNSTDNIKQLEEHVDSSLRLEEHYNDKAEEPMNTTKKTFSNLYVGITLAIIVLIALLITIRA